MAELKDVVIVSACRTPIGEFLGSLKNMTGAEMGAVVLKECIDRAGIDPDLIDDVIMGQTCQDTREVNVARVAALKAGLSYKVPGMTVNRVCPSSMEAMAIATAQIQVGNYDVVLAGGTDSMSQVPYILRTHRAGTKLRDDKLVDSLWEGMKGGGNLIMGLTGENLAEKYNISRQEQDEFALRSNQCAQKAIEQGYFEKEIVAVKIPGKGGKITEFKVDERPKFNLTMEDLAKLPPTFKEGGTITAGNASGLNDGASAMLMMSADKAKELGLKPLARIVGGSVAAVEPELMGYGPVPATEKLFKKTGLKLSDIGLIEVNEAFAAQYLAVEKLMGLNREITNVNGGAIALGHPGGPTGCRISITLLYEMKRRGVSLGLATLCGGNGPARSVIIEAL
ncbi:MAG: thiolase family protein [Spirochaetes bacterium]|nr:thiolase family protein [Spirochaetota bacterium]